MNIARWPLTGVLLAAFCPPMPPIQWLSIRRAGPTLPRWHALPVTGLRAKGWQRLASPGLPVSRRVT